MGLRIKGLTGFLLTAKVFFLSQVMTFAQGGSLLLPSIGLSTLPADSDTICSIPLRITSEFDPLGYQPGQPVHDFTLYDPNGIAFQLKSLLQQGKPVVLVTASYTCFVFRERLDQLKALKLLYGDLAHFLIIYTVEAHPYQDISPYYGYVNPGFKNLKDGVLFDQATTYGMRRQLAEQMADDLSIDLTVVIDGPCNEFWIASECGPVTAYVIDTSGVLYAKQGWFNQPPENLGEDLDLLLGVDFSTELAVGASFSFWANAADTIKQGLVEEVIYFSADLNNPDDSLLAYINVWRDKTLLPAGWYSSMCMDICYAPTVSKTNVYINPSSVLPFILDVYTNELPDTGFVRIALKNNVKPMEKYLQWFVAITGLPTQLIELPASSGLTLFPQPASSAIYLLTYGNMEQLLDCRLYSMDGRFVRRWDQVKEGAAISVSSLPEGLYVLEVRVDSQVYHRPVVIAR